jgi:cytochrome c oxidase assembly protein subunit 15
MTRLTATAFGLALAVVVLSAWIRLEASGLGCADWPSCYGTAPAPGAIGARLGNLGPAALAHRALASLLGLAVIAIAVFGWRRREADRAAARLALALLALTVFLAALGAITPAPRWPLVTSGNLLGGMALAGGLWWLLGRPHTARGAHVSSPLRALALVALALLALDLALGAWVSANYAAAACPALIGCGAPWHARQLFDGLDPARTLAFAAGGRIAIPESAAAIHAAHRALSLVTAAALIWLALRAGTRAAGARAAALAVLALTLSQMAIGFLAVAASLPLWLATTHNAGAVLLWLATLRLRQRI